MTDDATYLALDATFRPQSIAVVGVPRGPRPGRLFLEALLDPGFKGRLYAVNPNAAEILGVRCYPSVAALPETVDLAIILIPAEGAIQAVRGCAARGVKSAVLFTAGFSESDSEQGRQREQELLEAARSSGLRLIGPNCMGVYCPSSGLAMFPRMPAECGDTGFISQSGSLCSLVVDAAARRGLAFSKVVSVGNQCDLEVADFLHYLGDDAATKVIAAYVEGVKDGQRFASALRRVARRKPVLLWKSGRTAAGAGAARSHTGSLAGPYAVWQALLRQTGAIGVRSQDELIDSLAAVSLLPRTLGGRIAIITGPGGPAVSAADACEEAGLTLASLSAETQARVRAFVTAAGTSVRNPVDIGLVPDGAAEMYGSVVSAVAGDAEVDALLVLASSREGSPAFFAMLREAAAAVRKPTMLGWLSGEPEPGSARMLASVGLPIFSGPERALRAYAQARAHGLFQQELAGAR